MLAWLNIKAHTIPRHLPSLQTKETNTWPTPLSSLLNSKVTVRLIFILPINAYIILPKDQFKVNKHSVTSKQEHWKEDKAFIRCNSFWEETQGSPVITRYQVSWHYGEIHLELPCSVQQMSKSAFPNTIYIHRPKKNRNTSSLTDKQPENSKAEWGSCTFSLATKGVSQVISPGPHPCCSMFLLCCPPARIAFHRVILRIGLMKQSKLKIAFRPPKPNQTNPWYSSN